MNKGRDTEDQEEGVHVLPSRRTSLEAPQEEDEHIVENCLQVREPKEIGI